MMDVDTNTICIIPCGYEDCPRTFSKPMDYNRHRKCHERPFICSICDKGFGLKTDRDRHRVTHKANKFKFMCKFPGCNFKGTPRRDYLLKHMRDRHESARDPASKKSIQLYYEKSFNEEVVSQSEEATLRFLEAASQGDERLVKNFIATKVNICKGDSKGITAGGIAASKGHLSILRLLVEAGVNVNMNRGDPWLHQALRNGYFEIARYLIRAGAHGVDERSNLQLLFHEAIQQGDMPRMLQLIEFGAKPGGAAEVIWDCLSKFQQPALHTAAESEQTTIAEFLLNNGADIHTRSIRGQTAVEIAIMKANLPMVNLFLRCGARLDDPIPRQGMPLRVLLHAINPSNQAMVHLIVESATKIKDSASWDIKLFEPNFISLWKQFAGGIRLSKTISDPEVRSGGTIVGCMTVFLSEAVIKDLIKMGKVCKFDKTDADSEIAYRKSHVTGSLSFSGVKTRNQYWLDVGRDEPSNWFLTVELNCSVEREPDLVEAAIRAFTEEEGGRLDLKRWHQFPIEVRARLQHFTAGL